MSCGRYRLNESGASVIIGTLVLILVVVIGAASIGLMMSTAQKEEMNRQAHQSAVKNEKLDIDRIVLVNATNTSLSDRWAFVNFTIVNLDINDATVTIVGLYDQENKTYLYPQNITAGSFPSSLSLYERRFEGSTPRYSDAQGNMLHIAGKKSIDVSIDLTNFSDPNPRMFLRSGDEIRLILYTVLLNNFEERFIPPTPSVKISVESEDLGIAQRDYLQLDGTGSTDDGSITSWNWTVKDESMGNITFFEGKEVQARIAAQGPFTVNLTVVDDTLMKSTSPDYHIPANPRFNPPAGLNVTASLPVITACITSMDGGSVTSAPVDFLIDANPYGNITLSDRSVITDSCGCAGTNVSGGPGRIRIVSGNLPSVYVAIP